MPSPAMMSGVALVRVSVMGRIMRTPVVARQSKTAPRSRELYASLRVEAVAWRKSPGRLSR